MSTTSSGSASPAVIAPAPGSGASWPGAQHELVTIEGFRSQQWPSGAGLAMIKSEKRVPASGAAAVPLDSVANNSPAVMVFAALGCAGDERFQLLSYGPRRAAPFVRCDLSASAKATRCRQGILQLFTELGSCS